MEVTLTVATWNLAKRSKAAARLPELLNARGIDLLFAQEATAVAAVPDGYGSILHPSDPRPDTQIVVRLGFAPRMIEPRPLARLGSYASAKARGEWRLFQVTWHPRNTATE